MGFFKGLGELVGTVTGGVIGGAVQLVGEIVESDYIKDIGGAVGVAEGIITNSQSKRDMGFEEVGDAIITTAQRTGRGLFFIAENAARTLDGVVEGDGKKVIDGAKELGKVVAVATLAVGIGDYMGAAGHAGHVGDVYSISHSGSFDNI